MTAVGVLAAENDRDGVYIEFGELLHEPLSPLHFTGTVLEGVAISLNLSS